MHIFGISRENAVEYREQSMVTQLRFSAQGEKFSSGISFSPPLREAFCIRRFAQFL